MKNSYKSLFLLSFIFSVGTQSSSASQLNRAFLDFCDQNSKMETISQLRKISSCRDCHCLQDYLGSKKEVDFSNQNLGDIKFLRFFRHFLKIDLSDNRITDISPLANMRLLEQLWLDDNEIRQIQSLKFLKNLLLFSASYNHIENISAVSQCKKLQAINLSQNQIQNLTPLKQLDNLRFIYLSHNKIEDITPFSFLPGYRDLKTLNSQVLYHHSKIGRAHV